MRQHVFRPVIVGIGGTTRSPSSCEHAVQHVLTGAAQQGARVVMFNGQALEMPFYNPAVPSRTPEARALVAALREADAVVIASPGYHGTISGLVKNALDYTEDMRDDSEPYLDGRAVGLIACAGGWQATGSTINALRSIVHALRGWPSPLAAAINTSQPVFSPDGTCISESVRQSLDTMAEQIMQFAYGFGRRRDFPPQFAAGSR